MIRSLSAKQIHLCRPHKPNKPTPETGKTETNHSITVPLKKQRRWLRSRSETTSSSSLWTSTQPSLQSRAALALPDPCQDYSVHATPPALCTITVPQTSASKTQLLSPSSMAPFKKSTTSWFTTQRVWERVTVRFKLTPWSKSWLNKSTDAPHIVTQEFPD